MIQQWVQIGKNVKPLPFKLPASPVDKFKVRWCSWEIQNYKAVFFIYEAVYYQHALWREVFPNWPKDELPGVPFEQEWAVFRDGNFIRRCGAWERYSRESNRVETTEAWPSIRDAVDANSVENMSIASQEAHLKLTRIRSQLLSDISSVERSMVSLKGR